MSDIAVKLGYVPVIQDDGTTEYEPALSVQTRRLGSPVWAIPLSNAYIYGDEKTLCQKAFAMAQFFRMYPDRWLIYRIMDAVLNWLPDLIKMKPYQEILDSQAKQTGEIKVTVGGKVMTHAAVLENGQLVN
jgi:hypothetical protein